MSIFVVLAIIAKFQSSFQKNGFKHSYTLEYYTRNILLIITIQVGNHYIKINVKNDYDFDYNCFHFLYLQNNSKQFKFSLQHLA